MQTFPHRLLLDRERGSPRNQKKAEMVVYVVKSVVLGLQLKLGDALFESFAKKRAIGNLGSGQMLLILAPQKLFPEHV